jgi:hypothetical protein
MTNEDNFAERARMYNVRAAALQGAEHEAKRRDTWRDWIATLAVVAAVLVQNWRQDWVKPCLISAGAYMVAQAVGRVVNNVWAKCRLAGINRKCPLPPPRPEARR